MDQLQGGRFAPRLLLCELSGFVRPRAVQDVIHAQTDAVQHLLDLVDREPFIPGTRVRQSLRKVFVLIFRKIVFEDCRKFIRKALSVETVFELLKQKVLECLKSVLSD